MAWMLAPVPGPVDAAGTNAGEAGTRTLLVPVKTSFGDPGGGLALRISDNAVQWEPAPVAPGSTAEMLGPGLALPGGPPESTLLLPHRPGPTLVRRTTAAQWLQEELAAGPVRVGKSESDEGTLHAAAKSAGKAWSTVRRAFKELGGIREKCPTTRKQMWRLPEAATMSAGKDGG